MLLLTICLVQIYDHRFQSADTVILEPDEPKDILLSEDVRIMLQYDFYKEDYAGDCTNLRGICAEMIVPSPGSL